jgi:hypothetical protein
MENTLTRKGSCRYLPATRYPLSRDGAEQAEQPVLHAADVT